ncbi:MAG: sensor histidine kinase, partial [Bacteroidota bacterium]
KGPMSFPDAVKAVLESLLPLIERKHQILREEVPENLPLLVADEQRVNQILLNLLSNAIKFTPEGGTIAVRAWVEAGALVCEVKDSGIGIAPEDHPRLFKPFTQLDMSSTRKVRGTGLGLTIAKALVEAHGGTITAESPGLGKGATFRFTLPLA